MFVRYGNFDFEPWEASIAVNASYQRSARGFKSLQNLVFHIRGEVVANGQYDIDTRLTQIAAAFSVDGQSCGLMKDDGTPSHHWMPNSADEITNLTDVTVYNMELPHTLNGEYVSGRHFNIDVASLYVANQTELLNWNDSLTRISNAGPQWKWEQDPLLPFGHYPVKVAASTMQLIIHEGEAWGASNWILPPTPFYDPPFEANHRRIVTHHAPERYPQGTFGYKTSWRYEYTLPTFDDVTAPVVR